jgi:hypothetical protein
VKASGRAPDRKPWQKEQGSQGAGGSPKKQPWSQRTGDERRPWENKTAGARRPWENGERKASPSAGTSKAGWGDRRPGPWQKDRPRGKKPKSPENK